MSLIIKASHETKHKHQKKHEWASRRHAPSIPEAQHQALIPYETLVGIPEAQHYRSKIHRKSSMSSSRWNELQEKLI